MARANPTSLRRVRAPTVRHGAEAAKLLEAAGEELLAEEADGLAERVDLAEAAVRH